MKGEGKEAEGDQGVEQEPVERICARGIRVDLRVNIIPLKGGEGAEEESENCKDDFHGVIGIENDREAGNISAMSDVPRKVLFVCTGNTCRSPMAEGIFRKVAGENYEVSSAGVAAMDGSAASRETLGVLKDQGISLDGFRSRMVDEAMLKSAEAVFCMTEGHLEMLEMMHPGLDEKFHLACDFCEVDGIVGADVPDPIGMGRAAYDGVAKVLEDAVVGITGFLEKRQDS